MARRDNKDNIVIFPSMKKGMPSSIEEVKQNLALERIEIAEFLAEELTKEITRLMSENGYGITHVTDLAFLLITIKAILLRHNHIFHPFQELIDQNIKLSDNIVLPGSEDPEEDEQLDV